MDPTTTARAVRPALPILKQEENNPDERIGVIIFAEHVQLLQAQIESLQFNDVTLIKNADSLLEEINQSIVLYSKILKESKNQCIDVLASYQVLKAILKDKVKAHAEIITSFLMNSFDDDFLSAYKVLKDFEDELKEHTKKLGVYDFLVTNGQAKMDALVPKGIQNLGNSCYMNASIQALIGNNAIYNLLMNDEWPRVAILKERADADYFVAKELQLATQSFIRKLEQSKEPSDLKESAERLRAAIFASGIYEGKIIDQQDAGLLVNLLLEKIGFSIPYETVREVAAKKIRLEKRDEIGVLQVPIEKTKEKLYLQDQVNAIFKTTYKDDKENALYARGEYHPQYSETITLGKKPPQQIIVQLKRFGNNLEKIQDPVIVHQDRMINLNQGFRDIDQKVQYKVTGAIHHSGHTGGGHYVAFNAIGDTWYEVNDSRVTKAENIDEKLNTAYLLILDKVT